MTRLFNPAVFNPAVFNVGEDVVGTGPAPVITVHVVTPTVRVDVSVPLVTAASGTPTVTTTPLAVSGGSARYQRPG